MSLLNCIQKIFRNASANYAIFKMLVSIQYQGIIIMATLSEVQDALTTLNGNVTALSAKVSALEIAGQPINLDPVLAEIKIINEAVVTALAPAV